jgi:hypothetical protein
LGQASLLAGGFFLVSEADRLTEPTDFYGNEEIGVTATF